MKRVLGIILIIAGVVTTARAQTQTFDPVKEYWRADANRDHRIDISDIVTMINWIAEGRTYEEPDQPSVDYWLETGRYEWFPDVNKDNTVNISDIVAAINIIAAGKGSGSFDCAVDEGYCTDSNHPHAIDLGIGVPVACCNLGASYPDEHGGYYAWGETEERTDVSAYFDNNYPFFLWDEYKNGRPQGECWVIKDLYINLTDYDGPRKQWGGFWTLPTPEVAKTMVEKCTVEYTQLYGRSGLKVTGPNGKSVFLSASGKSHQHYYVFEMLKGGYFWTSGMIGGWGNNDRMWPTSLIFDPEVSELRLANISTNNVPYFPNPMYRAMSIRPTYLDLRHFSSCPDDNHPHSIDLGLPSGLHWACCNVDATSPEEAGGYYRWGSMESFIDDNKYTFPKDISDIASTEYDVANVRWQNGWKMPNRDEMQELKDNSTYTSGYLNGEKCAMITGPNGNHIFMNYAGRGTESNRWTIYGYGSNGIYYSSTRNNRDSQFIIEGMRMFDVSSGSLNMTRFDLGSHLWQDATPVRPVRYFY